MEEVNKTNIKANKKYEDKEQNEVVKKQDALEIEQDNQHNLADVPYCEQGIQNRPRDVIEQKGDVGTPDGQSKNDDSRFESSDDLKRETVQNNNVSCSNNVVGQNMLLHEDHSYPVDTEQIRISLPGHSNISGDSSDREPNEGSLQESKLSGNSADGFIVASGDNENIDKSYCPSLTQDKNHSPLDHGPTNSSEARKDLEGANAMQDQERQAAIEKLRKGQTYEEEEDFKTYEDAKDYNEAYDRAQEKYVFFWKSHDIYSQWNTKHVFYVDDIRFNCAEQFMMYRKAILFDDNETAEKILWCKDPRRIKALGREVLRFDQDIWVQNCLHIVKEGNMAKFTQNNDFLADILLTYPKVLVEASPYDTIWGIGLEENSPEAWDEATWKGTNYLGYVLTEVRDEIMAQRGMIDAKDRWRYLDWGLSNAGYESVAKPHEQTEDLSHKREDYFLFSGGIYSQWYHSYFTVDDTNFQCAEQYMMFQKAVLFQDDAIAKQILKCGNPKKVKELGRKVKRFNEEKWNQHCLQIVKEGNMAKFSQNEKLKKEIISTYPKIFVEASPYDRIWGIGLEAGNPNAKNKSAWRGKNWLGYVLTEVRDQLLFEFGLIKKEKIAKYIDKLKEDRSTSVDNDRKSDIKSDTKVKHSWFEHPSQGHSAMTKNYDRHVSGKTRAQESGGKGSARQMKNDKSPEKQTNQSQRNENDRQIEKGRTNHESKRQTKHNTQQSAVEKSEHRDKHVDKSYEEYWKKEDTRTNEMSTVDNHSPYHLATLDTEFHTQRKRKHKKDGKQSLGNDTDDHQNKFESQSNGKKKKEKKTDEKTRKRSENAELSEHDENTKKLERKSKSSSQETERSAFQSEMTENIDPKKSDMGKGKAEQKKDQVEVMSKSQKKKQAKGEQQERDVQKDLTANEDKKEGLSRRQKKNKKKKESE